jgi:hypothetical protein
LAKNFGTAQVQIAPTTADLASNAKRAAEKTSETQRFLSSSAIQPLSFLSQACALRCQLNNDESQHSDAVASISVSQKSANHAG